VGTTDFLHHLSDLLMTAGCKEKTLLVPQAESKHLQLPGALSFSGTQITPE